MYSFERADESAGYKANGGQIKIVKVHADDGRSALQVDFQPDKFPNVRFEPRLRDWRTYGGLAMYVFNPGNEVATFIIQVDDNPGDSKNSRHATGTIEPHAGASFSIALAPDTVTAGMRALPSWPGTRPLTPEGAAPFDLSHIAHFQIYMRSPPKPRRLIIDNVRLLPAIDFRGIIDRYGQYTRVDWPGKLKEETEFAEDAKRQKMPNWRPSPICRTATPTVVGRPGRRWKRRGSFEPRRSQTAGHW